MAKCAAKKALTVYSMPVCLPQREHRILLCWGSFFSAFVFGRWAFWGPESGPIAAKTNDVGCGEGDNIFLRSWIFSELLWQKPGKIASKARIGIISYVRKEGLGRLRRKD